MLKIKLATKLSTLYILQSFWKSVSLFRTLYIFMMYQRHKIMFIKQIKTTLKNMQQQVYFYWTDSYNTKNNRLLLLRYIILHWLSSIVGSKFKVPITCTFRYLMLVSSRSVKVWFLDYVQIVYLFLFYSYAMSDNNNKNNITVSQLIIYSFAIRSIAFGIEFIITQWVSRSRKCNI